MIIKYWVREIKQYILARFVAKVPKSKVIYFMVVGENNVVYISIKSNYSIMRYISSLLYHIRNQFYDITFEESISFVNIGSSRNIC